MVEKFYLVKQINAIGNGSETTIALVKNPTIEGCAIRATKVGDVDWSKSTHLRRRYVFTPSKEVDFIVIGNATCTEVPDDPFNSEVNG
jgi:hypothetical protein